MNLYDKTANIAVEFGWKPSDGRISPATHFFPATRTRLFSKGPEEGCVTIYTFWKLNAEGEWYLEHADFGEEEDCPKAWLLTTVWRWMMLGEA